MTTTETVLGPNLRPASGARRVRRRGPVVMTFVVAQPRMF